MTFYKLISVKEFLIFLLAVISLFGFIGFYKYKMSFSFTHKAIKFFKKKQFSKAQSEFYQALNQQVSNPWSHLNIALSYDMLKRSQKALKSYQLVSLTLAQANSKALFYSYFNQGELQARLGDISLALHNYQQALKFQYQKKKIKTNIELLFKKSQSKNKNKNNKDNKNQQKQDQQKQDSQNKNNKDNKKQDSQNKDNKNQQKQNLQNKDQQKQDSQNKDQQKQAAKQVNDQKIKAIFEEIKKQEQAVRSRIYQKKYFREDKAQKDW